MKHAIILFVHQIPEQINKFIDQILASTNMDIYIHINAKCDSIRDKIHKHERIAISNNCFPITWGGDGLFQAILQMFREVLNSGKEYGQVLLCSGQDMIVRDGIDDFLDNNLCKIYLDAHEADESRRIYVLHKYPKVFMQLLDNKWDMRKVARSFYMRLLRKYPNLFLKHIDYNTSKIKFYYSTFWGAIPFKVIKHIVHRFDSEIGLKSIFLNAFMSEESFLATMIMNSEYRDWLFFDEDGYSHSLTYIKCIKNGHPPVITMQDISSIESSNCFFARKFDVRKHPDVVEFYHQLTINKL